MHYLLNGVFALSGLGLGILLARSIVSGTWLIVAALVILVPAMILFLRYPMAALIIWLVAGLFLQTTPNDPARAVYWMIHRAMPPLVLGLVVLGGLFKVRAGPPVRLGPAGWAMVIFLGWAVANIFWFQRSPSAYLYWLYDRVFVPMCLYGLVRLLVPRASDLRRLIPIAAIIVLFETTVGLLSWLYPEMIPPDWVGSGSARTIGTLRFYTAYTTTLVFLALLVFQSAMNHKPGAVRSALLIVVSIGALGVFLSFSRGSWLAGMVVLLGLLLVYPRTVIRGAAMMLVVMLILGATVLSQQIAFAQERLNSDGTALDRLVLWDAGIQLIERQPLFGWGYGDYAQYAWKFQRRVDNHIAVESRLEIPSHNSYIGLAAEMGLPALALYLFPALWWLLCTLKVLPHMPQKGFWGRSLLIILWLVILDHVVVSSFSDMRISPYATGMWWITLGLIANLTDEYLPISKIRRLS